MPGEWTAAAAAFRATRSATPPRADHPLRRLRWACFGARLARRRAGPALPGREIRHRSLLLRRLGETLSFRRTLGPPTRRRGCGPGMLLRRGAARPGTGGGRQIANLPHWLVLHHPLTVTERSEHSDDPFPDHRRLLPRGVGAVFYNCVHLQFRTNTEARFQMRLMVGERHLEGELRADREPAHTSGLEERNRADTAAGGRCCRGPETWRGVVDRRTGERGRAELVPRNRALIKSTCQPDPPGADPAGGRSGQGPASRRARSTSDSASATATASSR